MALPPQTDPNGAALPDEGVADARCVIDEIEKALIVPRHAGLLDRALLPELVSRLPVAVYTTDAAGLVTYVNAVGLRLLASEPEIGTARWWPGGILRAPSGEEITPEHCPMATALKEKRALHRIEATAQRPDGTSIPVLLNPAPVLGADGQVTGGFNVIIDISERKRAERQVAHLARHDLLTGLPNRKAFDQHLGHRLAQAERQGTRLMLMRIDLDGFKALNDEFGHGWGDTVLVELARRLGNCGADVFPARTGGDEFMLVMDVEEAEDAAVLRAARICELLRAEVLVDGLPLPVGSSAGCALFPQDAMNAVKLIAAANAALQAARSEFGGLRMFDLAQQRREIERMSLREQLRRALAKGEISPYYQPLFRRDGEIVGFEALARWHDPQRGPIPPAEFIAAAEEGGLIGPLGENVLRAACKTAAGWVNPLRVAVNISALQIQTGDLPALVQSILTESGLAPERLELEITEGVMVTEPERAMACLCRLRSLGVRIALDDFGTGYSSLSYLHHFPLTTLKIDRSFIANLGVTLESVAITRAIIQLGQALGIEVVAEGVETPEQLDFLIQEGCDLTQGYLLGRPMPAAAWRSVTGARRAA